MSETDRERLRHMLDAAREAVSFAAHRTMDIKTSLPELILQLGRLLDSK